MTLWRFGGSGRAVPCGFVLVLVLLVAPWGTGALAQSLDLAQIGVELEARLQAVREAGDALSKDLSDTELNAIRAQLGTYKTDSRTLSGRLGEAKAAVESRLAELGPPPEPDDTGKVETEPETVAKARAELTAQLATLEGLTKQSDLIAAEADALTARIGRLREQRFLSRVLERGPSSIDPTRWRNTLVDIRDLSREVSAYLARWWEGRGDKQPETVVALAIVLLLLAVAMLLPLRLPAMRRLDAALRKVRDPDQDDRLAAAAGSILLRVLPVALAGFLLAEVAMITGLVGPEQRSLAVHVGLALVIFTFANAAPLALLAPADPDWRVIPVQAGNARVIRQLITVMGALFALDVVVHEVSDLLAAIRAFPVTRIALLGIVFAVLLWLVTSPRLWRREGAPDAAGTDAVGWRRVSVGLRIVAVAIVAAGILGYAALAAMVAERLALLVLTLAVLWLWRGVLRAGLRRIPVLQKLATAETGDEATAATSHFWLFLSIDVALFLVLAPVVLVELGADWQDIREWISAIFFGVQIGPVTVSLSRMLISVAAFAVIMMLTGLARRALDQQILPRTRMDRGVQASLLTLFGYVGITVAVLTALAVFGIDLTQLALIAGALSVGIGFGLQGIVNNFVSGLILLFERPIKVGDWISVPSGEGYVRRISVRATEIQAFDRSSIVVPNSELISSTVRNLTLEDKLGRFIIPVGVSYNSDPQQVKDILIKCATDHPLVRKDPAPFAHWANFGDSALEFELRGYISDINDIFTVLNDLRMAISLAFREAGVEIPFPQRDLHIRTPAGAAPALPEDKPDGRSEDAP